MSPGVNPSRMLAASTSAGTRMPPCGSRGAGGPGEPGAAASKRGASSRAVVVAGLLLRRLGVAAAAAAASSGNNSVVASSSSFLEADGARSGRGTSTLTVWSARTRTRATSRRAARAASTATTTSSVEPTRRPSTRSTASPYCTPASRAGEGSAIEKTTTRPSTLWSSRPRPTAASSRTRTVSPPATFGLPSDAEPSPDGGCSVLPGGKTLAPFHGVRAPDAVVVPEGLSVVPAGASPAAPADADEERGLLDSTRRGGGGGGAPTLLDELLRVTR
mmetsp:Transcript_24864/g.98734  ORF Transcript_24864/g.98734 Transcript_24864/m.98734 type:complete len:275 (+) Transcript_24864:449-1273(+)